MTQVFNELMVNSQNGNAGTDLELLEVGETIWLSGQPAPAEKGTVALQIDGGATIVLKEKDVVETHKDGQTYFVKVKAGADIIYRLNLVSQVRPHACECNGKNSGIQTPERESIVAKQRVSGPVATCTVIYGVEWTCQPYWDEKGYFRQVCTAYPTVHVSCGPIR